MKKNKPREEKELQKPKFTVLNKELGSKIVLMNEHIIHKAINSTRNLFTSKKKLGFDQKNKDLCHIVISNEEIKWDELLRKTLMQVDYKYLQKLQDKNSSLEVSFILNNNDWKEKKGVFIKLLNIDLPVNYNFKFNNKGGGDNNDIRRISKEDIVKEIFSVLSEGDLSTKNNIRNICFDNFWEVVVDNSNVISTLKKHKNIINIFGINLDEESKKLCQDNYCNAKKICETLNEMIYVGDDRLYFDPIKIQDHNNFEKLSESLEELSILPDIKYSFSYHKEVFCNYKPHRLFLYIENLAEKKGDIVSIMKEVLLTFEFKESQGIAYSLERAERNDLINKYFSDFLLRDKDYQSPTTTEPLSKFSTSADMIVADNTNLLDIIGDHGIDLGKIRKNKSFPRFKSYTEEGTKKEPFYIHSIMQRFSHYSKKNNHSIEEHIKDKKLDLSFIYVKGGIHINWPYEYNNEYFEEEEANYRGVNTVGELDGENL